MKTKTKTEPTAPERTAPERVKPQIEMDKADYKQFRQKCGKMPVRWVLEEIVRSLASPTASDMVSLNQVLVRLRASVERGERRMRGRPSGSRDSFKRDRRPRKLSETS